MSVALYEFLGVRKGFGRVWVTIYIYIAVPKVVRVWHFTVVRASGRTQKTNFENLTEGLVIRRAH